MKPISESLALRIEPESRGGQRELSGTSCNELVRAAAIIVALSIDPQLQLKDDPPTAWATAPEEAGRSQAPSKSSRSDSSES
jgi:hypothetical protein